MAGISAGGGHGGKKSVDHSIPLVPFIDLAPRLKGLADGDRLSFERHLQGGHLQGGGDA